MSSYGERVSRRKIMTTVYLTAEQNELLQLLKQKTNLPIAKYIRQGIDLALENHRSALPGQDSLPFDEPAVG